MKTIWDKTAECNNRCVLIISRVNVSSSGNSRFHFARYERTLKWPSIGIATIVKNIVPLLEKKEIFTNFQTDRTRIKDVSMQLFESQATITLKANEKKIVCIHRNEILHTSVFSAGESISSDIFSKTYIDIRYKKIK